MSFDVYKWGIILFLIFYNSDMKAQTQTDELFAQLLETINQDNPDEFEHAELIDQWNYFIKHPIDLNLTDKDELKKLFFLSEVQIQSIISHREHNGSFLDILELQTIQELDIPTIRLILPFVEINQSSVLTFGYPNQLFQKAEQELMIRFGNSHRVFSPSDQPENLYLGSPFRMLLRYKYNFQNKLFATVNMEKDSGEQFFRGSNTLGFDFYSGSIYLKDAGIVKKFIIGDYSLCFGQGLALWSGSGFGKGAVLSTIARQDYGLRPYSSLNEALFFRGISGTVALKKVLFTPFLSIKKFDASADESENEVSTLILSGLHRTESELNNQNRLGSFIFGANTRLSLKKLSMGFTAFQTRFDFPLAEGKHLYQRYDFHGDRLINTGFYYSYTFKNTYLFGEIANSNLSGKAVINGLMSSLSSGISLVLLHRDYSKNYHSFFSRALSESSSASNEKGFLAGAELKLGYQWDLFAYTDLFRFPWLKFRVDGPSKGFENFIRLSYKPNKKLKFIVQYKQQIKQENADISLKTTGLDDVERTNYRLELNYKINASITLRNRAELVAYKKASLQTEYGFLNYQDILYDPMSSRISANMRFGIFDTEGFNSRIYTYENDVLYAYSVPAYQGSGLRFYFNFRYSLSKNLDVWLRYAHMNFQEGKLSADAGKMNRDSDFRVQLRYHF